MVFEEGHPNYLKKHTEKTKKKLSEQRMGKKNPVFKKGVRGKIRGTVKRRYKEGTKMGFQLMKKESIRKVYKKTKCEECGSTKNLKLHHIDSNQSNHLKTNLEVLCNSCHISKHYQPYMIIGKLFTFEAAHSLKGVPPCDRVHGHSYKLEVRVGGRLNKQGMVKNYTEIKEIVNKEVISKLDHYYLNDIVSFPTAENLLVWIFRALNPHLKGLKELSLKETATSIATLKDTYFLDMLGE